MADLITSVDPKSVDEHGAPAPDGRKLREPLWRHMVGDQLRRLRHERGETLGETAKRAGVSPQYLSELERGRKEPSSEMIAAVTGALDITLVDLTLEIAACLIATQEQSTTTQVSGTQSQFVLAA
jgi:DNA-binding XRE family transcriptional regulator